jgi:hypothetical protein
MPIFYLEPKDGDTSDHNWQASYLREGCWVEAETEAAARLRVTGATLKMVDAKFGHPMRASSPWEQTALTTCRPDKPSKDVPPGKIMTKSGKILDV